jgi:hypothetical protein
MAPGNGGGGVGGGGGPSSVPLGDSAGVMSSFQRDGGKDSENGPSGGKGRGGGKQQSSSQQQGNGGSGGGDSGSSASSAQYGLLGLLGVIRMVDADVNTLALGSDLTTLGLNLNSSKVMIDDGLKCIKWAGHNALLSFRVLFLLQLFSPFACHFFVPHLLIQRF